MEDDRFLFKLGALLAPVWLAKSSPEAALLLVFSFAVLTLLLAGWKKAGRRFLSGGLETWFWIGAALAVTTADLLAQIFFYDSWRYWGLLFPVILVSGLFVAGEEAPATQARLWIWFALGALLAPLACAAYSVKGHAPPFAVFLTLAFSLALLRFGRRRRWVSF